MGERVRGWNVCLWWGGGGAAPSVPQRFPTPLLGYPAPLAQSDAGAGAGSVSASVAGGGDDDELDRCVYVRARFLRVSLPPRSRQQSHVRSCFCVYVFCVLCFVFCVLCFVFCVLCFVFYVLGCVFLFCIVQ
jgi:hypothetical protein